MKKPPCIRGLKAFKSGCPERPWDGEEGCPAWVVRAMPRKDNPLLVEPIAMCLDHWMFRLSYDACGLLEGNQQAVESFRNGMTLVDPDTGKTVPRPDPASVAMFQLISLQAQKAGIRRERIEEHQPILIGTE